MARSAGRLHDLDSGWYRRARCRTTGPLMFFSEDPALVRQARRLCRDCTVRERCLEFAMANVALDGMWGGLTAPERAALRRQENRRVAG